MVTERSMGATILRLLADRSADSSICPSEVARCLSPHDEAAWRGSMPAVLQAAFELARSGQVRVTRGPDEVSPLDPGKGPVRLRRGPQFKA